MTYTIIRILIFVVIAVAIYLGVRKIWRDWTGVVRQSDAEDRKRIRDRDEADRRRGGLIDLERDADGKYRPRDGE